MSSVVISGNTSGTITLDAPAVAGTTTLTLPATSGTVMVNGPAFSAYMSSNASFTSGTNTKVTLDTEVFDTANCFSSSRFTPNVAGYYQINGKIRATGTGIEGSVNIYKNGSQLLLGSYTPLTSTVVFSVVSTIVYLNGSTDYIELYGYASTTAGNPTFQVIAIGNTCEMSGSLVRAA